MGRKVDRLMGLEWLKGIVDKAYKEAVSDARDELDELNGENGSTSIESTLFGPDAGTYKYSRVNKKHVVDYEFADADGFDEWCRDNVDAVIGFAARNAETFGKEWFDATGELPEGISRIEYDIPAMRGAPKLYGFDPNVIQSAIGENILEGANRLLLGDGE